MSRSSSRMHSLWVPPVLPRVTAAHARLTQGVLDSNLSNRQESLPVQDGNVGRGSVVPSWPLRARWCMSWDLIEFDRSSLATYSRPGGL